ncbi:MAG TPA: tripartite tricarboxylate transporter substrate-binding protein, partial [Quisquiliibacterium sp.]|nr:tripartite tricarboxylate transporter substrate-binding protein [Quisquiliibacterium sp.]
MLRRIAIRFIEENSGRCVERHADRPIGANVLIENKAGASGILAGVALKDAPPDGTVIMFAPSSATVAQKVTRKSMPFDLEKDLAPIGMAGTTATVYV